MPRSNNPMPPLAERERSVELVAFTLRIDCFAMPDATLEIDVDEAVWAFDGRNTDRFEQSNRMVFVPAAGYAARRGDVMLHGDAIAPALGSPNVSIGGRPALRSSDSHVCTRTTPTPHAAAGFVATYDKVRINGHHALRVGDYVDEGPHGHNPITMGCPSVVIGPMPAPVECWQPAFARPAPSLDRVPFRWQRARAGRAEGKVVLGAKLRGFLTQVDGMTTAARLWAEP
jgi:uncharacterized Zn-binding protein involved in type VI secretion